MVDPHSYDHSFRCNSGQEEYLCLNNTTDNLLGVLHVVRNSFRGDIFLTHTEARRLAMVLLQQAEVMEQAAIEMENDD